MGPSRKENSRELSRVHKIMVPVEENRTKA